MNRLRQPEYWSLLVVGGLVLALVAFLYHLFRSTTVSLDHWIFYRWYEQPENRWWLVFAGLGIILLLLLGRALVLRNARWRWLPLLTVLACEIVVIVGVLLLTLGASGTEMAQLTSTNLDDRLYGAFYQPPPVGSAFCSYAVVECDADGRDCHTLYDSMVLPKNIGLAVPLKLCDISFSSSYDPARFRFVTAERTVSLQIDSTPVFSYPSSP